ncbi:hypothetical protein JHK85_033582 [Glycine max]|nr:hypothetical protein JHK85_033582 [Glycine max]
MKLRKEHERMRNTIEWDRWFHRSGGHGTDEELQEGVIVASDIKFEEARDENHRAGVRPISTKKKTSREGCKGGALLESTLRVSSMESEDDMPDANDIESLDDDFYSGETEDAPLDYYSDYDADDYFDDAERIESRRPEIFTALYAQERSWCCRSVSRVHDAWFADEERVRKAVGLLEKPIVQHPNTREVRHGFLGLNTMKRGRIFYLKCHSYISTSINDGPGCLMLRCPDPTCDAAIGQDMINLLVSDEDKQKYARYLLRSYIEDNKKSKWCPAPGCEYAVTFDAGSTGNYDVSCLCSYGFCWNCTEEAHRPVDCGTVAKWILKNSAESENMNWLCVGAWSDHGERTGGFYACNRYEAAKQEGVVRDIQNTQLLPVRFLAYDDTERRREMAKNSLERYTHYYERWASNQSIEKLSDIQCQPESQLKFITEAWLQGEIDGFLISLSCFQIIECRRVLKWTYAYGFYLPEHEHAKKQFFEYLQGEAESGLERLHQCAEKELQPFLSADDSSREFNDFRTKLAGLTSVTRNYFENLVRALENGLSDVGSNGAAFSKATSSKNAAGSSKGRSGRGKGTFRSSTPSKMNDDSHWCCEHCTYANAKSASTCQMCYQQRR